MIYGTIEEGPPPTYAEPGEITESNLPDAAIVCNCASCRKLLVVHSAGAVMMNLEPPAGRVYDRPYCRRCIDRARRRPLPPENHFRTPDPN